MPLGTKVGLGPDHILLHGDPGRPKRGAAPNFRPMSIVAKRSPISATAEYLYCLVNCNSIATFKIGLHSVSKTSHL